MKQFILPCFDEDRIVTLVTNMYGVKPSKVEPWINTVTKITSINANTFSQLHWRPDTYEFVDNSVVPIDTTKKAPIFLGRFDFSIENFDTVASANYQYIVGQTNVVNVLDLSYGNIPHYFQYFAQGISPGQTLPGPLEKVDFTTENYNMNVRGVNITLDQGTIAAGLIRATLWGTFEGYRIWFR